MEAARQKPPRALKAQMKPKANKKPKSASGDDTNQ